MGGLVVAFGALTAIPALQVQRDLTRAKASVVAGKDAFFVGDLRTASHQFQEASSAFIQAQNRLGTPLLRFAASLPLVGRTPDAIGAMTAAGAAVAGSGSDLVDAVQRLPGGLGALAPRGGVISIPTFTSLRPVLLAVRDRIQTADALLAGAQRGFVLGPVARTLQDFREPLARLDGALHAASTVAERLPSFLGEGPARRYFVAAQNPAELRGTGGFIGSYSILTARNGRLTFSSFEPIETLPDAIGQVSAPNRDYEQRYGPFGGAGFWRNINVTPDFPSAAVAIERLYREVKGVRLDGAIGADPQSLAALLATTGPVDVPSLGVRLDAGNVVDYTTNRAYRIITDPKLRKRVLGDAAKATFDRFMQGSTDRLLAVRSLVGVVANGDIVFHARDPLIQAAFVGARVAGALVAPPGDYLAVSATNSAANKLDYYVRRSIDYRVTLLPDGSSRSALSITFRNPSPTSGEPAYVVGPHPPDSALGEMVSYVSAFCSSTCELDRHTVDGVSDPVGAEIELGHHVYAEFVHVPAGGRTTLGFDLRQHAAWEGDKASGRYVLTFQGQPGTIRPTQLTIEIQAPFGTRISRTSVPMEVSGSRAVWTGPADKLRVMSVEFQRPLLYRAGLRLVQFLFRPIV